MLLAYGYSKMLSGLTANKILLHPTRCDCRCKWTPPGQHQRWPSLRNRPCSRSCSASFTCGVSGELAKTCKLELELVLMLKHAVQRLLVQAANLAHHAACKLSGGSYASCLGAIVRDMPV